MGCFDVHKLPWYRRWPILRWFFRFILKFKQVSLPEIKGPYPYPVLDLKKIIIMQMGVPSELFKVDFSKQRVAEAKLQIEQHRKRVERSDIFR